MESLALSITVPLAIAFTISTKSRNTDSKWWDRLNKPVFAPPRWVFKPVWIALYIGMGWASHLIAVEASTNPSSVVRSMARRAVVWYWAQFAASSVWAPLFFKAQKFGLAWGSNAITCILIGSTVKQFAAINRTSTILMTPYLFWAVLNGFVNLYIALQN
ncbi:hypothetical protein H4R33_002217 [Dimargaris cristalligena]|nr:hypothetical protein H4R33_002217 [Dimargaris cristalligena]